MNGNCSSCLLGFVFGVVLAGTTSLVADSCTSGCNDDNTTWYVDHSAPGPPDYYCLIFGKPNSQDASGWETRVVADEGDNIDAGTTWLCGCPDTDCGRRCDVVQDKMIQCSDGSVNQGCTCHQGESIDTCELP